MALSQMKKRNVEKLPSVSDSAAHFDFMRCTIAAMLCLNFGLEFLGTCSENFANMSQLRCYYKVVICKFVLSCMGNFYWLRNKRVFLAMKYKITSLHIDLLENIRKILSIFADLWTVLNIIGLRHDKKSVRTMVSISS